MGFTTSLYIVQKTIKVKMELMVITMDVSSCFRETAQDTGTREVLTI